MPAKQDAASSIWSGLADGLEDILGDSPRISTLEPGVVLDADAREERDLLAPQARHAAMPAVLR